MADHSEGQFSNFRSLCLYSLGQLTIIFQLFFLFLNLSPISGQQIARIYVSSLMLSNLRIVQL